jgi:hypothetical protein
VPYSPAGVRRALENTAQLADGADMLTQGFGLLQVDIRKTNKHLVFEQQIEVIQ